MLHARALSQPALAETPLIEGFADLLLASTPQEKAAATDRAADVLARSGPDDDYPHGLFLLGWSEMTLRRDGENTIRLLLSARHEADARGLPHLARAELYEIAEHHVQGIGSSDEHGVPWDAYRRLASGRLREARGLTLQSRLAVDPLLERDDIPVALALLAELYRRSGEHAHARTALSRIAKHARPQYVDILIRTTLAAMDHAEGRPDNAGRRLSRALSAAVEHDTFFPFLAGDDAFGRMLEDFARSGTQHEERLAKVFALRDRMRPASEHDALTPRERELLGFLRTSMTSDEIAAALHLSVATVKTHLRSIYRKFGVSSRREAVRIAR